MKLAVILSSLLACSVLMATGVEQFTTTGWGVRASLENVRIVPRTEDNSADNNDGLDTISSITKTFALPFQSAAVELNRVSWNVFDSNGTFLYKTQTQRENTIVLAKSFTFREFHGFTVRIAAQYSDNDLVYTLDAIDFDLVGSDPIDIPAGVSPAFVEAYKTLADNWDTCYLRDIPLSRPRLLIISHSQLEPYQADFIKWKKQLGFEVYVVNKTNIGTTLNQFKTFIANHYIQYHCDYLLLFGDVGDPSAIYTIPTAYFPSPEYSENDADDQQYGMILGEDYFPEMLVGRFSFGNVMEFIIQVTKTISYEKTPYMDDTGWMQHALTVAGNYAEGELRPTTPVQMSRWLRGRLLDFGYTEVDTVFYPDTYPGTALIQGFISQGVQYVSYRGWGDANGWHYPVFHIGDLERTY
ncbi:MAG TPA: C25 family cysteine peptidase, partial [Candidatus Cloacimonadota bacterium]|nr:C25 family cysteine peptidase [Candidatus Cloacimonadota bacterium]